MDSFPVAHGLLRHGYKLHDYGPERSKKLRIASALLSFVSVVAFLTTIYIYNPANTFGDSILASPQSTLIASTYDTGCNGLSAYAVANDPTLPTSYFSIKQPGIIEVEMSYQNYSATFEAQYTITESGLPVDGNIITNNQSIEAETTFQPTFTGNVTMALAISTSTTIRFSGDPDECASFFTSAVNNFVEVCVAPQSVPLSLPFPICEGGDGGLGIRFDDVLVQSATYGADFPDYYIKPVAIDADRLAEEFHDIYCFESNGVSPLHSRVAPFSCVVNQYRGWLEVIALSFSNTALVYAVLLRLLFYVADAGSKKSLEDIEVAPPVAINMKH